MPPDKSLQPTVLSRANTAPTQTPSKHKSDQYRRGRWLTPGMCHARIDAGRGLTATGAVPGPGAVDREVCLPAVAGPVPCAPRLG